jgi:hypothetical protein
MVRWLAGRRLPGLLVLVTLINGLLYLFTVPPWQHYDEPNHFEYVWLAANQARWPQPGDYDQGMRRQVAESMIRYSFFVDLGFLPELDEPQGPIWIGQFSQLDDQPVYYWAASLPLRLFPDLSVTRQLVLARGVSLLFFAGTVLMIHGTLKALLPARHPLLILVPLGIALLPPFADIMTAVNNDVAAVLFFSAFLMGMVYLLKRGFSFKWLLFTLLMIALGLFSKRTTFLAVPLFLLFAPLVVLPARWRWLWWVSVPALFLALAVAVFSWGEAALWHRNAAQAGSLRVPAPDAVWGSTKLALVARPGDPLPQMTQFIPLEQAGALAGQVVTLGGWFWADHELLARSPAVQVYAGNHRIVSEMVLSARPTYHAWRMEMPPETGRAWVTLAPFETAPASPAVVYIDGLFLGEGDFSEAGAPLLAGGAVHWGAVSRVNLLRNGSFEQAWPYARTWADELSSALFPDYRRDNLSVRLYTILDVQALGWYYQGVLQQLFRSFWGVFGWGHVSLPAQVFPILGGLSLLGLLGALASLPGWWPRGERKVLALLVLAGLAVWGLAAVRGAPYVYHQLFYPPARYAFTALLPAYLPVIYGLHKIISSGLTRARLDQAWAYAIIILPMAALNLLALASIYRHYAGLP